MLRTEKGPGGNPVDACFEAVTPLQGAEARGDIPPPPPSREPHHPPEPQAGLTRCAQRHVGWGHVRRRLEGLDLSGRLAGWASAHDIHLAHAEAEMGGEG